MSHPHTIPVLGKALRVVQALVEDGEAATCAELAGRLSISPSTCYRILQTFVAHDWLRPSASGSFIFSTGLLPLLEPLSDYRRLFDHLKGPLERLGEETGLTAKISVKQGDRALTVYRVESSRGFSPSSKIGASFPLGYGSSGACLLSGLPDDEVARVIEESPGEVWRLQTREDVWGRVREVRKKRVCYDAGQFQPAVHGASSPVDGPDGKVFAAVTVVGWAEDFQGRKLAGIKRRICACTSDCTRLFGEARSCQL